MVRCKQAKEGWGGVKGGWGLGRWQGPWFLVLGYTTYKICYVKYAWGKLWRSVDRARVMIWIMLLRNNLERFSTEWAYQVLRVLLSFPYSSKEQPALAGQPDTGSTRSLQTGPDREFGPSPASEPHWERRLRPRAESQRGCNRSGPACQCLTLHPAFERPDQPG